MWRPAADTTPEVLPPYLADFTFFRARPRRGSTKADFPAPSFPVLPRCRFSRTLKGMEVHFAPDLQAKIDQLVKLLEDAMAGYVAELAETREMLNSRYDDLKSGKVKPIDGEAFFESLRKREDELLNMK
jgi:hypothetical protein